MLTVCHIYCSGIALGSHNKTSNIYSLMVVIANSFITALELLKKIMITSYMVHQVEFCHIINHWIFLHEMSDKGCVTLLNHYAQASKT